MIYLFCVLVLYCLSVMAHIFYCRRTPGPGLHAKAYILIAAFFFAIYVLLVFAVLNASVFDPHSLLGLPFQTTSGIIFVLLVPVYLCFYTLTQLMSPSKKILLTISRLGEVSYDDIIHCIEEEDFIGTRLSDLLTSGCVVQNEKKYVLSPIGQRIAALLKIMQQVLGRDMGG